MVHGCVPVATSDEVTGSALICPVKYGYLQDEEPANVSSVVESLKRNRDLLLFFDGAEKVKDLLKPSSGSVIQSILEGRTLPDAHVIISSHPSTCPSLIYFYI